METGTVPKIMLIHATIHNNQLPEFHLEVPTINKRLEQTEIVRKK
jgi:hypothetical protein